MPAKTSTAKLALPASQVDLSNDSLTDQIFRSFLDFTDELVSRHTSKSHVAFKDLKVG
jgi:hypothetical protein